MKATVVRYQTRPEAADENQRLIEKVFAELAMETPDGVRYLVFRLADEVTFVHVFITDGDGSGLTQLTAFNEFQRGMRERAVEPPQPATATLVGSYRFATE